MLTFPGAMLPFVEVAKVDAALVLLDISVVSVVVGVSVIDEAKSEKELSANTQIDKADAAVLTKART